MTAFRAETSGPTAPMEGAVTKARDVEGWGQILNYPSDYRFYPTGQHLTNHAVQEWRNTDRREVAGMTEKAPDRSGELRWRSFRPVGVAEWRAGYGIAVYEPFSQCAPAPTTRLTSLGEVLRGPFRSGSVDYPDEIGMDRTTVMRLRLALVLVVLVAGVGPGWAGTELYIFDVLRRPYWAATYDKMMRGERGLPTWFANASTALKTTTSPAKTVQVGGVAEDLFRLCQPHQCANGTFAVLFSDEGGRSVGAFYDTARVRFFGNPTAAERNVLQSAAQDGI